MQRDLEFYEEELILNEGLEKCRKKKQQQN